MADKMNNLRNFTQRKTRKKSVHQERTILHKKPRSQKAGVRNQWRLSQRMIARIKRTDAMTENNAPRAEKRTMLYISTNIELFM